MVIRAWLFILFWAIVSFAFLLLGFHALDKTELSHSVSPVVMFLFKHSLAVSSCFASSYALKIRAQSTHAVLSNFQRSHNVFRSSIFPRAMEGILIWYVLEAMFGWLWFPAVSFLSIFQFPLRMLEDMFHSPLDAVLYSYPLQAISCSAILTNWNPDPRTVLFYIFSVVYIFSLFFKMNLSELQIRVCILLALKMSIFIVSKKNSNFSPILVLFISHWISVCWAKHSRYGDDTLVSGDLLRDGESMEGLVRTAVKVVALMIKKVLKLKEHKAKKLIKFGTGALGSVLFQSFFKITSFTEVAAFLCFTVVWLANLVLLGFKADFGIFNFLLLNVVLGCTVGQFGLHGETWLALAAAILLYAVGLKLQSIAIPYEQGQQMQISFFAINIRQLPPTSNPLLPST